MRKNQANIIVSGFTFIIDFAQASAHNYCSNFIFSEFFLHYFLLASLLLSIHCLTNFFDLSPPVALKWEFDATAKLT